jgi:hypothetical protein
MTEVFRVGRGAPEVANIFILNYRRWLDPASISDYTYFVLPTEGCFANVTNAGKDAMDAERRADERLLSAFAKA